MANESNLIPINKRSKEEQKTIRSKAQKASVESRKRKKSEREKMKMLLALDITDDDKRKELLEMGIEPDEADVLTYILCALIRKAESGDVQAIKEVRNIAGTDNAADDLKLRKADSKRKQQELEMKKQLFEKDNW